MKKLIVSALLAAGLAAVGGTAFAQAAEGQAGSAYRQPGAADYGPVPGTADYYCNSGFCPPPTVYYDGRRVYSRPYAAAPVYPHYPYATPYARTQRDRDGDGVINRRDRFPDDPSRQ